MLSTCLFSFFGRTQVKAGYFFERYIVSRDFNGLKACFTSPVAASMSQAEWEEGLSRRDELESVLRDVLKMLAQHQGQQWQKSLGDSFKVWVNVVTVKRLVWK